MEGPDETLDGLRESMMDTRAGSLRDGKAPPTPLTPPRRPAKPTDPEFPIKHWDRYECLAFLGQGGMGIVFLAKDKRLGREVAIKFVRSDDGRYLERFTLEARAQARVDHVNVCKVFEVGEVEGKVFITMQPLGGASLDTAAAGLSLEQKVMVLRDAALGVHEAHRVGIIHRDLKPSNIMVERTEDGSLKNFVMDFGLAREWNEEVTETTTVLGTPAFMSPEQARGEITGLDRRTDVYSLGATLYFVLTGRPPVTGANALEIISAVSSTEVQPFRAHRLDLPKDLEAITLKCLEKVRGKRYDSAKALAEDLNRFLSGEPVQARPTGFWYRTQRKLQKHRQLTAVGAAALVLVAAALGVAIKARRDAGHRERLARQFTEATARIESMARYSALSPLHDIRPDLKAVQIHMADLQAAMKQAGALAQGSGHYALGRGYWTLDDTEKAREHLQMGWDAGFREPRAAYALAVVIGRQYQEKLLEAERIASTDQREARKKEIESTLRKPALAYLQQASGAEVPSPAYLAALMAFYEGRLDEALARLQTLGEDLPWFFEAPLLRGSLLQARAWKHWNQGQPEAARADFAAGREALAAAAASGRSAPTVHAALADLELNALFMEKYGEGQVEPAFTRGMTAVKTALAAQPDHVSSLILEASLLINFADVKMNRGEKSDDLVQQAVAAAQKAVAAGTARIDARVSLGKAYYQWGNTLQDQNRNPTEPLAKGLQVLESLTAEKRDYMVENHLGLIHQTWSDYEDQIGRDSSAHLSGAISAYERATHMEPHLLPAWINLGTCLRQRAVAPKAANPEADLKAALTVLDKATSLNPKHFVPYFVRGKVHYDLGMIQRTRGEDPRRELELSLAAYQSGISINPKIPHLYNGAGMAQSELARAAWDAGKDPSPLQSQTEATLRKGIEVAPGMVNAYSILGDALLWKARIDDASASAQALKEAEALFKKGLMVSPGNKSPLANLGRLYAVKIEGALRQGGDARPSIAAGEAVLAKALVIAAGDRETLQYLGELRSAAARWKANHHTAESRDFESAADCFKQALTIIPDSQETLLALAHLYRAWAEWERTTGKDPRTSLALGRATLEQILKVRPKWAELLILRGRFSLEEAEGLPPDQRGGKAKEALRDFQEASTLNRNLARECNDLSAQAKRMGRGPF